MDQKDLQSRIFDFKKILIPPHPLTNYETHKYYQNKPIFNGVYSRDNLPDKIKDRAYVINLDEYWSRWVVLYLLINIATRKNKKKYISSLGECPTLGLDDTTLTTEKNCSIGFTVTRKKSFLRLCYNGANSYLFVNVQKLLNLKQKNLKLMQLHYV